MLAGLILETKFGDETYGNNQSKYFMKTIRINNCKKALLNNKLNDKEIEVSEGVAKRFYPI